MAESNLPFPLALTSGRLFTGPATPAPFHAKREAIT